MRTALLALLAPAALLAACSSDVTATPAPTSVSPGAIGVVQCGAGPLLVQPRNLGLGCTGRGAVALQGLTWSTGDSSSAEAGGTVVSAEGFQAGVTATFSDAATASDGTRRWTKVTLKGALPGGVQESYAFAQPGFVNNGSPQPSQ